MRPTTVEEVDRDVRAMAAEIEAEIEKHGCPDWQRPLFEAAEWLSARMREDGASEKATKDASFALGQRVFMVGMSEAYKQAAMAFDRFREGRPDRGGRELAVSLIDGTG